MKKLLLPAIILMSNIVLAQNLVTHFDMDGTTSTTLPTSTFSVYGTGTPSTITNPGATLNMADACYNFFNGQGVVSSLPLNNMTWNGTAMSLWYKSTSTYQGNIFQGAYLGFGMRMLTNGTVQATFDGAAAGSYNSTIAINDGFWHHIVAQNNGTTTEIYLDGVLNFSGAESLYKLTAPNSQAVIYLGAAFGNLASEKIYGSVDEIKVYDDVLSQSQIDALYAYAPCVVNIPDANFKTYLVGNTSINTNGDSEIQCTEAASFNGTLICSNLSITDMTGIEAFTSLNKLDCQNNSFPTINLTTIPTLTELYVQNCDITSLDLSGNTQLIKLYCGNNDLTSLSLTNNTTLTHLSMNNNFVTSISFSTNPAIYDLNIAWNGISNLDLSNLNNLAFLNFQNCGVSTLNLGATTSLLNISGESNYLTSINLANRTNLNYASFYNNQLTSFDVSNCTSLTFINVQQNQLTSLDLSTNTSLARLFCGTNQLTTIDVSMCSMLYELNCITNNLTTIKINNGNNSNIGNADFWATDNVNLSCIQVDNVAYSTTNWSHIDQGATFSANCALFSAINENNEIELSIYPNPIQNQLNISTAEIIKQVVIVDLSGAIVYKGIENQINTENLAIGTYIISIETSNGTVYERMIKE